MTDPQPGEQRGGEEPRHQLQSDNSQQSSDDSETGTVSGARPAPRALLCCQMCTAQGTHTAASTKPDTATHRWTRQETEVTAAHMAWGLDGPFNALAVCRTLTAVVHHVSVAFCSAATSNIPCRTTMASAQAMTRCRAPTGPGGSALSRLLRVRRREGPADPSRPGVCSGFSGGQCLGPPRGWPGGLRRPYLRSLPGGKFIFYVSGE